MNNEIQFFKRLLNEPKVEKKKNSHAIMASHQFTFDEFQKSNKKLDTKNICRSVRPEGGLQVF